MVQKGSGGRGGDANVHGEDSSAKGGPGGDAVVGDGGDGGHATVAADRSHALGGRGGRGRIGPGGQGGDAYVTRSNAFVAGGQGGEASQVGGRGGRGGLAFMPDELAQHIGTRRPAHMRWPYYEPVTEPGRGGDSPDTPQYKARRLIVEQIKMRYFGRLNLPLNEVWWDREVVSLAWINEQLEADGHLWRASVFDDEYEFSDVGR